MTMMIIISIMLMQTWLGALKVSVMKIYYVGYHNLHDHFDDLIIMKIMVMNMIMIMTIMTMIMMMSQALQTGSDVPIIIDLLT